jgi:AraC family ethanolamine operon transcriptional activator
LRVIDQHLSALPRRAEYDDVEAVRELAGRQDVRFDQLGRGRMRSSYALLTTPNLHVSASFHSVGAIAQGAAGKGLCIIGVPGEDGPERSTGGWCADGDCVLVRSGQDYLASSRRPFRTVTVVLSQSRLEQDFETTWGLPLRALAPGRRLGMATPAAQRWLHHRLRAWVSPGRDGARIGLPRPGTDAETEDAIVEALLRAAGPRPAPRPDPGRFALARRAERMIRESLADDMSITGFAAGLGTSLRTLELGFRDLYGTSLRVYRHALRLNAARRDLLRGDGEESVGTVAIRWGLLHLGRFSTDYRRMFGESPSETRRTTRRRR